MSKSPGQVVKDAVTLKACLSTDLVFVAAFLTFFVAVAVISLVWG